MTCTFYLDLIFSYLVLQCSTRYYRELHGVTWWYMVLHGVDIVLQAVKRCYIVLRYCYIVLHCVTKWYMVLRGADIVLRGVKGWYMVLT